MNEYKRKYREMDDATKQKISQKMKGKPKSFMHKQHISQGMKDYWSTVPSRGDDQENYGGTSYAEGN